MDVLYIRWKGQPTGDGTRLESGRAQQCALGVQLASLPQAFQVSLRRLRGCCSNHHPTGSAKRVSTVRRHELRLADFLEHPNARLAYELEGGNARLPGPGPLKLERIKEMRMVLNETMERFSAVDSPKSVKRGSPNQIRPRRQWWTGQIAANPCRPSARNCHRLPARRRC